MVQVLAVLRLQQTWHLPQLRLHLLPMVGGFAAARGAVGSHVGKGGEEEA